MENILCWSGGKDSTATLILAYEHNIKIDTIIFSEVMFDNKRNISGENPEFIKWVYEIAIPKIKQMGFNIVILRNKKDAITCMNQRVKKSKHLDRIGKKHGIPMGMGCFINGWIKIRNITDYLRERERVEIVGIAYDEKIRLERMHKSSNKISLLEQFKIEEKDTFKICEKYGLLNPIYKNISRGGCWFCPNQSIKELSNLYKNHKELFDELDKIITDTDCVHPGYFGFRDWNKLKNKAILESKQISLFDVLN